VSEAAATSPSAAAANVVVEVLGGAADSEEQLDTNATATVITTTTTTTETTTFQQQQTVPALEVEKREEQQRDSATYVQLTTITTETTATSEFERLYNETATKQVEGEETDDDGEEKEVTEEKPFVEEGESKEDDKITQVFVELSPGEDTQDSQGKILGGETVEKEMTPLENSDTAPAKTSEMDVSSSLAAVETSSTTAVALTPSQASHFVVVAVDFGTTFSGYAFAFTRDPTSIHMMRKWEGGDPGVINAKTPTCLLLDPAGEFKAFGYAARDCYHDLDKEEAKNWLFFDKFKMLLHHSKELNKDTRLKASNGKTFPAVQVFAHSLRFFKEHALQELSDQSATEFPNLPMIINDDIRWVITVPAIWRQPAKQFMREAAYLAGMASSEFPEQLLIALEPEAASIYCRKLRIHHLIPETQPRLTPHQQPLNVTPVMDGVENESVELTPVSGKTWPQTSHSIDAELTQGSKYMVVDCGGGTVDITVHQLEDLTKETLKELHKASGGPHGAVGVDSEFERLLERIFGRDFVDLYRQKRSAGYVDLMSAFEAKKRTANPNKESPLNISLPFSFIDYYKKSHRGHTVETAIKRYGDPGIKWSSQGFLRLSTDTMASLFQPTLDKIKDAVENVLNSQLAKDVSIMFLVGGFAESPFLQQELRRAFGHSMRIIIPQDVALTILKGAVVFGLDPTVVTVRRSRLTYGIGVLNRFRDADHPREKLVVRDNQKWCTDIFDKFVRADESVGLGDTVLRRYTPAKPGQTHSIINIYCSEEDDPKFVTDGSVHLCGTLFLDMTDIKYDPEQKRREIQTRMTFGDTEIKVSALDVATKKCVKASVDFLK